MMKFLAIAMAQNGKRLATVAKDNRLRIWDTEIGGKMLSLA